MKSEKQTSWWHGWTNQAGKDNKCDFSFHTPHPTITQQDCRVLIAPLICSCDSVIISPTAEVSGFINSVSGRSSVFELRLSPPSGVFHLKLPLVCSAARWLKMLLQARERRRKTCRPRAAKEPPAHAKKSKWQPCCYSSFREWCYFSSSLSVIVESQRFNNI